jgi:phosphatidate cytidylyltransferase
VGPLARSRARWITPSRARREGRRGSVTPALDAPSYQAAARGDRADRACITVAVDDLGSESETEAPTPATPLSPPPSSKKAAARKRAQLRKRTSSSTLVPTESGSLIHDVIPPVPALPVGVSAMNGGGSSRSSSELEVKEVEVPIPTPSESVSSSDAEEEVHYSTDEDEDDEPSSSNPAPILAPSTPPPARSASPHSPGAVVTPTYTGADHDPNKKMNAIIQRTIFGFLMASSLVAIVCMGHVYVIVLMFASQAIVFSELSGLFDAGYSNATAVEGAEEKVTVESQKEREREMRRKGRREERDRWSRRLSW